MGIASLPYAPGRRRPFRTFDPESNRDAKKQIVKSAWAAGIREPHTGPVEVELEFHFARPKAMKDDPHRFLPRPARPDIDNLEKMVLDALNGIAYLDDAQVYHVRKWKLYAPMGQAPKTIVIIRCR